MITFNNLNINEINCEKIVDKIWGKEYWIVNKDYGGKLLELKKQHCCSVHKHKEKTESFFVIRGRVLIKFSKCGKEFQEKLLFPGQIYHVKKDEYHAFYGIEESLILEFSTHHKDEDSYRLTESKKLTEEEFKELYATYKL